MFLSKVLIRSCMITHYIIKSPCIIYADFESILVPEDNRMQNPEESYTKSLTLLIARKKRVNIAMT